MHGTVYGLWRVGIEAGILEILKRYFSDQKRDRLSVGETLFLAAIHRAVKPSSKRSFSEWASGTTLPFLAKFSPKDLTSQHFWDQMEAVSEEDLERAEEEIAKRLIERFRVSLDVLLYDVTNFYTHIATDNKKNKLCQRGRNKQRRNDLRQFNLSLLVSREFFIPILSRVYEGNITDVSAFPAVLSEVRRRLASITQSVEDITLVFDRGNYSKRVQRELTDLSTASCGKVHWVGGLSVSLLSDFTEVPKKEFYSVRLSSGKEILAYRMEKELWGKEVVIVIAFSDKLQESQLRGFQAKFESAIRFLEDIAGTRRSLKRVKAELEKTLTREHLKEVIIPRITKRDGKIVAKWRVDKERYKYLVEEYFGRKVLFTTRKEWSDREIIEAYYGLGKIENIFKRLKNPFHFSVIPQFHWTDQKIKVHIFCCIIGLILAGLLHKKARVQNIEIPPGRLLNKLSKVREALVIEETGGRGKPRVRRQLEEMDEETKRLFEAISIQYIQTKSL